MSTYHLHQGEQCDDSRRHFNCGDSEYRHGLWRYCTPVEGPPGGGWYLCEHAPVEQADDRVYERAPGTTSGGTSPPTHPHKGGPCVAGQSDPWCPGYGVHVPNGCHEITGNPGWFACQHYPISGLSALEYLRECLQGALALVRSQEDFDELCYYARSWGENPNRESEAPANPDIVATDDYVVTDEAP